MDYELFNDFGIAAKNTSNTEIKEYHTVDVILGLPIIGSGQSSAKHFPPTNMSTIIGVSKYHAKISMWCWTL